MNEREVNQEELIQSLLSKTEEQLPSLLEGSSLSEEQCDLVRAGVSARRLVVRAPYQRAVAAMISARQLYVVAYRELQSLLSQENVTVHELTGDTLIQSAMHSAAKPFSEHVLIKAMADTVMPWLADVVDKHTVADALEAQAERAEEENARRVRPVPIGLRHSPDLELPVLDRNRSLVLTGWRNAVLYLLDQITNAALVARDKQMYTVARLTERRLTRDDIHRYLVYVHKDDWAKSADSKAGMLRLYDSRIFPMLSEPMDLFICDDLTEAVTKKWAWRPPAADAGDANNIFSKLCKVVGSACVGGVPFSSLEPPDIRLPEWEQLRTFSTLRQVLVQTEAADLPPDTYRISIGNVAHYWEVSKSVLDRYDPGSGIIVPEPARLIT